MSSDPISLTVGITIIAALLLFHAMIILCNTAYSNVSLNRVLIPNSASKDKKGTLAEKILQKPFRCRYTNRIVNYVCIIAGYRFVHALQNIHCFAYIHCSVTNIW